MSATFAEAFSAVDGRDLEPINPALRSWTEDPKIGQAFRDHDYGAELDRVFGQIRHKWRQVPAQECEDAVSEALAILLGRRRDLFEGPPDWMGLLMKTACDLLNDWRIQRERFILQSIDAFYTEDGPNDQAMVNARLLGSGIPTAAEAEARDVVHIEGEPWTRVQMIGAAQRFYYGPAERVPKWSDCKRAPDAASNGLPTFEQVAREFGSFPAWLKAAGLEPTIDPRPVFGRVEAAKLCAAFHRRKGRWPNSLYFRYSADFGLPPERVAAKFFGGASPAKVQRGVEAILAEVEQAAAA